MNDGELLVDLLGQLEEVKFRQLFRTLIDNHSQYGGELVTYATSRSYVFAQYVPAGVFTSNGWFFQLAYLPALLHEAESSRPFFLREIRKGLEDLRLLGIPPFGPAPPWGQAPPNLPLVLRRDYHQPGAYTYHFVTNLRDSYLDGNDTDALEHSAVYRDAQATFAELLSMSFDPAAWGGMEFGIGSPLTIAQRPEAVRDELLRLLNAPSDYVIVARQGELALVPTVNHGLFFASEGEKPGEIADVRTGMSATICSAIPLDKADSALQELETLIRAPQILERDLQQFFEEHPKFLTCLDERYSEVRSHVCLIDGAENKLVPDFMMRIEDSDVWDIVELKLPNAPLSVEALGVSRPSAIAARGIAELLKYRDYSPSPQTENGLRTDIMHMVTSRPSHLSWEGVPRHITGPRSRDAFLMSASFRTTRCSEEPSIVKRSSTDLQNQMFACPFVNMHKLLHLHRFGSEAALVLVAIQKMRPARCCLFER